jgi:hypothetical protein
MEELHRFIQRLDSAEKKYFRRYGLKDETKGDSQTKALFELLESAEVYDEQKIANRIKRLNLEKQLAHTEDYLMKLLIDTMLWYQRERFPGFMAAFNLAKIQFLNEKEWYSEAERTSLRMMKASLDHGTFTDRWNAVNQNIDIAFNDFLSDKKKDIAETNALLDKRAKLLEQMNRFEEYDNLLKKQQIIIRKAMEAKGPDDLQLLNEIMENKLLQNADMALSGESKFIFHTLRIQYYNVVGNSKAGFAETEALVALHKTSSYKNFATMHVLWAYSQYAQSLYFSGQWDKLEQCLQELNNIATQTPVEAIAKFSYYVQLAIPLLDHNKDTVALTKLLHEVKEKLKTTGTELRADVRMVITLSCVSGFVEYKEYNSAIDVCEHFLTHYDTGVRLDIMLMLYAYQFIAHLELGNKLYVNNVMQNVNRYFLRNEFKGNYETTLLKTFRKLSEIDNPRLHKAEIIALKTELEKSATDSTSQQMLSLLPLLLGYLDSKVN